MNTTSQKNELIFSYSSGILGEAKSLFVSTYLFLNSLAAKKALIFDNILAENLTELDEVAPQKLNYKDCINTSSKEYSNEIKMRNLNPLTNLIGDFDDLNWKSIYKGFNEFNVPVNDDDTIKLADTPTLASAGTALNITNVGAGNHRFANITAVSASNGGENGYISIRNTFTIFKGRVGVT